MVTLEPFAVSVSVGVYWASAVPALSASIERATATRPVVLIHFIGTVLFLHVGRS